MAEQTDRAASISPAHVVVLAGGVAGVVSVFLGWVAVTHVSFAVHRLTSQLGIEDLPSVPGLVGGAAQGLTFSGRSNASGIIAGVAGLLVVMAAVIGILLNDPGTRRMTGLVAAGAGALMVVMAIRTYLAAGSIAENEIVARAVDQVKGELGGAFFGLGFLIDQLAGAIKGALEVEAHASVGLYTAAGAGLVATAAGLLAARRPTSSLPGRGSALERVVAGMDPGDRTDLLRALTAPAEVRADEIRRFHQQPRRESWAEVLNELQRDEAVRADVVEALRRLEGR